LSRPSRQLRSLSRQNGLFASPKARLPGGTRNWKEAGSNPAFFLKKPLDFPLYYPANLTFSLPRLFLPPTPSFSLRRTATASFMLIFALYHSIFGVLRHISPVCAAQIAALRGFVILTPFSCEISLVSTKQNVKLTKFFHHLVNHILPFFGASTEKTLK